MNKYDKTFDTENSFNLTNNNLEWIKTLLNKYKLSYNLYDNISFTEFCNELIKIKKYVKYFDSYILKVTGYTGNNLLIVDKAVSTDVLDNIILYVSVKRFLFGIDIEKDINGNIKTFIQYAEEKNPTILKKVYGGDMQ